MVGNSTSQLLSTDVRAEAPSRFLLLPSWIVSIVVHAGLLVVLATTLRSCDGNVLSNGEGNVREVGIYLKPSNSTAELDSNPDSAETQTVSNATSPQAVNPQPEISPEQLANALELPPQPDIPRIGLGSSAPKSQSDANEDFPGILRSGNQTRATGANRKNSEKVPFFGIRDQATRFVYVVDSSGSMANHGAMRVAKGEVAASLESLDATQQFQLVFYNTNSKAMTAGGRLPKTFWATEINRTLARQFLAGIHPDGGTSHVPALKKALSFSPDVVFFLTDADEPRMTAADLDEVRRANRSDARIHCVEFGRGSKLAVENFLVKLARDNGGTYVYRDVTQFGPR